MSDYVAATRSTDYPTACPTCGLYPHRLSTFPKGLCLPCYERTQVDAPMPTASEIVAMWRGL